MDLLLINKHCYFFNNDYGRTMHRISTGGNAMHRVETPCMAFLRRLYEKNVNFEAVIYKMTVTR